MSRVQARLQQPKIVTEISKLLEVIFEVGFKKSQVLSVSYFHVVSMNLASEQESIFWHGKHLQLYIFAVMILYTRLL